jgi:hypothetical protein
MSGALVIALILACVGALALASRSRREGSGEIAASESPDAATERAVSYMVSLGFVLSQKTDTSATFSRRKRPNTDVGILLLLLGIVPGALYFLLAGGERRTTVEAVPAEVGRGARSRSRATTPTRESFSTRGPKERCRRRRRRSS